MVVGSAGLGVTLESNIAGSGWSFELSQEEEGGGGGVGGGTSDAASLDGSKITLRRRQRHPCRRSYRSLCDGQRHSRRAMEQLRQHGGCPSFSSPHFSLRFLPTHPHTTTWDTCQNPFLFQSILCLQIVPWGFKQESMRVGVGPLHTGEAAGFGAKSSFWHCCLRGTV